MIINICSCTAISNVKGSSNFDIYLDRQFRPTRIPVKHWTPRHKRITTTPESESDKSTCDFLNSFASIFLLLSQAPPQVLATTRWPGLAEHIAVQYFFVVWRWKYRLNDWWLLGNYLGQGWPSCPPQCSSIRAAGNGPHGLVTFGAETPPPSDVRLVVGRLALLGDDPVCEMVSSGQPETTQFSFLIYFVIF